MTGVQTCALPICIFRGALDVRAKRITEAMKTAAAYAIAGIITDDERDEDHIIPSPFDKRVTERVAEAVGKAWTEANEAK